MAPLPWPFTLEVDGVAIEDSAVREYLQDPWAEFCRTRFPEGDQAAMTAAAPEFSRDLPALFEDLVRAALFLREAERRFPELDPVELQDYEEAMKAEAGAAHLVLVKRLGERGLQDHLERQLRMRKLERQLLDELPPLSEEEVARKYQQILADMPAEHQPNLPSYEELAPLVQRSLEMERAAAAAHAWVDQRRSDSRARASRPDGSVVEF